jgi:anaphase-promoting complex subunit 2
MVNVLDSQAFVRSFSAHCEGQQIAPSSTAWTELLIQHACKCVVVSAGQQQTHIKCTRLIHDLSQVFHEVLPSAFKAYVVYLLKEWCEGDKVKVAKLKESINSVRVVEWNEIFHRSVDAAIMEVIEGHVKDVIEGTYDEAFIQTLTGWVLRTLSPAVALLKQPAQRHSVVLGDVNSKLQNNLMNVISRVRSKELFEIIADFPDSLTAVQELKESTQQSGQLSNVGKVLRQTISKRLLHPGASTLQIVEMYVLMIRTLRILDPSDLLLTYVASPVRAYLKSRKDTVRCVVTSLSQGSESDLYSELRKGSSLAYGIDEDDEESAAVKLWEPRKRNPELVESGTRGLDVLALLVSIYGSIDLFVSEYRSLLAEKLLQNSSYQTDHEVATLELMKIRQVSRRVHHK